MRKLAPKIVSIVCALLCVCVVIGAVVCATKTAKGEAQEDSLQLINLWQIDSFEGGKGSRAEYLRSLGSKFSQNNSVYIEVTALSADAARQNILSGVAPDIISYGSGFYGLETAINQSYKTTAWCRGGYCLLSLQTDDFTLATAQNTVINAGKDNLTSAAALFSGLQGADLLKPTSAYVSLINGKYIYLLGTQRDIARLITRGVNFFVSPITIFNDLYQNISVLTSDSQKAQTCSSFIDYVESNSQNLSSLYLFYDGIKLYDNALSAMEGLDFDYTVPPLIGESAYKNISAAIETTDADKLKSLLKSL